MEAGLIRAALLAAVTLVAAAPVPARAGCDLDALLGYQLVAIKTIDGYQDGDGKTHKGFDGCEAQRLVMFSDRSAVRCVAAAGRHLDAIKAYVFARNSYDLKLCVQDDLFEVSAIR